MGPAGLSHRRTHNLLLISKLLNQRDHASPFTLVLDTLEQPAQPLLREYLRRSRLSKTRTIFLSFETHVKPKDVDFFVQCFGEGWRPERMVRDVMDITGRGSERHLIIIDSLATLLALSTNPSSELNLTALFSSLLTPPQQNRDVSAPQRSLVAVDHVDIPTPCPPPSSALTDPYAPAPRSLLSFLATTKITVHPLFVLLAEKSAQAKSQASPVFGLAEQADGVVVGLKPKNASLKVEDRGIVLEMEHRRKSGRGVLEWYFLPTGVKIPQGGPQAVREIIILLDDHPSFRKPQEPAESPEEQLSGMTFDLGLTDRQRLEREGVVLPYFDAQKAGGGGEGGRILYDMGVEDDFDEEEDEI